MGEPCIVWSRKPMLAYFCKRTALPHRRPMLDLFRCWPWNGKKERVKKKSAGRHLSRSSTGREALYRPIGHLRDALARAEEALLGRLPVDDVPDVLYIGSLAIEILLW